MRIDNFAGNGLGDLPSIIYVFNDSDGSVKSAPLSNFKTDATTSGRLLGNSLSHSTSQIKLQAKRYRLTKRSGCLNTSCFFPNQYKRLPSESHCSVSRPFVWACRDDANHREACRQHQTTIELGDDSTTATR